MKYILLSGELPVNRKIPCKYFSQTVPSLRFVRNRYKSILCNALLTTQNPPLKTTHAVYTMHIRSYTNRLVNKVRLLGETET